MEESSFTLTGFNSVLPTLCRFCVETDFGFSSPEELMASPQLFLLEKLSLGDFGRVKGNYVETKNILISFLVKQVTYVR